MNNAGWYSTRAEVARELALRLDRDALAALLREAGAQPAPEPARRAQLRLVADGTLLLLELGGFEAGAALGDRVAALAGPEDEAVALLHATRAAVAAGCGALGEAREDAIGAARAFVACGLESRALAARVAAADLSAELGDLLRARAELDPILARRDLPATVEARARFSAGKVLFATLASTEARLMLRRVAPVEPWIHGRALIYLARAALRTGHANLAENEARAAACVLAGLPAIACAAQAVLAQALLRQQRTAEAVLAARAAAAAAPAPDLARLVVMAQAQLAAELGGRTSPTARTA